MISIYTGDNGIFYPPLPLKSHKNSHFIGREIHQRKVGPIIASLKNVKKPFFNKKGGLNKTLESLGPMMNDVLRGRENSSKTLRARSWSASSGNE